MENPHALGYPEAAAAAKISVPRGTRALVPVAFPFRFITTEANAVVAPITRKPYPPS
jgi:hypothetical protein